MPARPRALAAGRDEGHGRGGFGAGGVARAYLHVVGGAGRQVIQGEAVARGEGSVHAAFFQLLGAEAVTVLPGPKARAAFTVSTGVAPPSAGVVAGAATGESENKAAKSSRWVVIQIADLAD